MQSFIICVLFRFSPQIRQLWIHTAKFMVRNTLTAVGEAGIGHDIDRREGSKCGETETIRRCFRLKIKRMAKFEKPEVIFQLSLVERMVTEILHAACLVHHLVCAVSLLPVVRPSLPVCVCCPAHDWRVDPSYHMSSTY
jgi:hypothetical protein